MSGIKCWKWSNKEKNTEGRIEACKGREEILIRHRSLMGEGREIKLARGEVSVQMVHL